MNFINLCIIQKGHYGRSSNFPVVSHRRYKKDWSTRPKQSSKKAKFCGKLTFQSTIHTNSGKVQKILEFFQKITMKSFIFWNSVASELQNALRNNNYSTFDIQVVQVRFFVLANNHKVVLSTPDMRNPYDERPFIMRNSL